MSEIKVPMYINADDVGELSKWQILDYDEDEIHKDKDGKEFEAFNVTVQNEKGLKRIWTPNKTSQIAVARKYGTERDGWKKKGIVLYTVKMNVRGEMKNVIYARIE